MKIELRTDRGTKALLALVVLLLAANLFRADVEPRLGPDRAWAQDGSPTVLNAGGQRVTMIKELRGLRADVRALQDAITKAPLPVEVVRMPRK